MSNLAYSEFGKRESWTEVERSLFIKVNTEMLPLEPPEAVVWIEGDEEDRVEKVVEVWKYYNEQPFVILSGGLKGNPYRPDKDSNPQGGNIPSWEIKDKFIQLGINESKIVLEDKSLNSLDQAVNVVQLVKNNDWKKIVLVASMWHQMRLFLAFVKQLELNNMLGTELVNQPETRFSWDRIIPGRGKNTVEMIQEDLWRIDKYSENGTVARVEDGKRYLSGFDKKYADPDRNLLTVLEKIKV